MYNIASYIFLSLFENIFILVYLGTMILNFHLLTIYFSVYVHRLRKMQMRGQRAHTPPLHAHQDACSLSLANIYWPSLRLQMTTRRTTSTPLEYMVFK